MVIKSVHIVAVIVWIGALLVTMLIACKEKMTAPQISASRLAAETAIGVAWAAGIALVLIGGWYTALWWQIKIVLVIAISAIHAIMYSRWKRQSVSGAECDKSMPAAVFVLLVLVVMLAIFKRPY